jgi:hypothetical protein
MTAKQGEHEMRKWTALTLVALLVVTVLGIGSRVGQAIAAPSAQSCDDYVAETNDRLLEARSLLYPAERTGAFEGSLDEAAGFMTQIADEQAAADPPDQAEVLHDDLIEALSAAEAGLYGDGDATSQILFAKSIIYNADARLLAVNESC